MGIPSSVGVKEWNEETGKHYSIFFNVLVLLTLFNEINARKLSPAEVNVFENIFDNPFFLFIVGGTMIVQLIMAHYGSKLMGMARLSVA